MNRQDLPQLAEERLLDAQTLLNAGQWSGAYHKAGYTVECALKACVAKLTREHDFPDIDRARNSYTDNLSSLITTAQLTDELRTMAQRSSATYANWVVVKDWHPRSRYERTSEAKARILLEAITDPAHGVLPWIKKFW